MLERIEKSLFEIKQRLLGSKILRQCLGIDSNNALNMDCPAVQDVSDCITTEPIYSLPEDYKKNAIIQLELDNADNVDNTIDGIIRVNIVMNKEKWNLVDNRIRPLVMSDEAIRLIDGHKFSLSNKLNFTRILPLIINKNVTGFALLFEAMDGKEEPVDI